MSWALVTGAGQRLGRAVALELARASWGVVVHYRNSGAESRSCRRRGARARRRGRDRAGRSRRRPRTRRSDARAPSKPRARRSRRWSIARRCFEHDTIATLSAEALRAPHRAQHVHALAAGARICRSLPEDARGAVVNFLDFKLASPYPDHFSYTLVEIRARRRDRVAGARVAPRFV